MYSLDEFDFHLPEALIAQRPAVRRERSRLMHLQKDTGRMSHHVFADVKDLLRTGDILVVNDTEVIPGRLIGRKQSGGRVEVLILNFEQAGRDSGTQIEPTYECLVKSAKSPRPGTRLIFDRDLEAEVLDGQNGIHRIRFTAAEEFTRALYRIGRVPLPPYIKRSEGANPADDRRSYQTVYAANKGAIAAPTAGLHFSDELLKVLVSSGITVVPITLHVGYGTFMPVRVSDIRDHRMHSERFAISPEAAQVLNRGVAEGRRVVAVGTTCVRTLEYAAADGPIQPGRGRCDLFIYPGYRFGIVDAMITNFHLPKSTLLMLVSAFAGTERVLAAYRRAVADGYRFYSYGDAMFID